MSDTNIRRKLYTLLKMYKKSRKKKEYEVQNEVFDITLLNGNWLSSEDKEFCYLRVDNNYKGAMGYCCTIQLLSSGIS